MVKVRLPDCPACKYRCERAMVKRKVLEKLKRGVKHVRYEWIGVGYYCRMCDMFYGYTKKK